MNSIPPELQRAADELLERGVGAAVITLGEKGALFHGKGVSEHVPAVSAGAVVETPEHTIAELVGAAAQRDKDAWDELVVRFQPLVLSVTVLVIWVREPASSHRSTSGPPVALSSLTKLPATYWIVLVIGAVLTLARFSEAFLVLRAQELGIALAMVPIVLVVMNLAYTAIAYPTGLAADRGHGRVLLTSGFLALIAADLVLAMSAERLLFFIGIVLWGAHMGLTQGLLSAMVADAAPPQLRGTAFGVFHLLTGTALLPASVLPGWLWSAYGSAYTFYAGAVFTAIALAGLLFIPATHALPQK
jgi:MFS family permease